MTLYELSAEQCRLLDGMIDACDPESGELPEDYAQAIDAAELAIAEKLDAIEAYRRGIQAEAAALRIEEKRMAAKRRTLERRDERLEEYVLDYMARAGLQTIKAGRFDFRAVANAPRLVIEDGANVPAEYLIPQPEEIDKEAIKDALKMGAIIPGFRLERGRSLRVK